MYYQICIEYNSIRSGVWSLNGAERCPPTWAPPRDYFWSKFFKKIKKIHHLIENLALITKIVFSDLLKK